MEYYDHFQATKPATIDCQEPTAVYAAHRLPDGTWHCLLTEAQRKAYGVNYKPFSVAPAECKGQGVTTEKIDGVDVKVGYPAGAPVHVFGDRVREPDKTYLPGSAEPIDIGVIDIAEIKDK